MTFADDFLEEEKGLDGDYPTAFGITFTPMVIGIAIAIFGLAGAAYIYTNLAGEANTKYQEVKKQLQEKQAQLNQINQPNFAQEMADMKAEVAKQKAARSRVIAMFTNEEDLETILIDLNSFISANQGELVKYDPDNQISVVNDGSLGNDANGKIKRKGFSLEIKGTFNQTQAIVRDIERLQPLLMIQNYSSEVDQEPTVLVPIDGTPIIPQEPAILETTLEIDAILPMSQRELEAAQKAEQEEQSENDKKDRKNRRK